jgi:hypothetical protein
MALDNEPHEASLFVEQIDNISKEISRVAPRGQASFKELKHLAGFIQVLKISIDGMIGVDRQLTKVKKSLSDTLVYLLHSQLKPDSLAIYGERLEHFQGLVSSFLQNRVHPAFLQFWQAQRGKVLTACFQLASDKDLGLPLEASLVLDRGIQFSPSLQLLRQNCYIQLATFT